MRAKRTMSDWCVSGCWEHGRKVEYGDKEKMRVQGDGRSGPDRDIREGVAAV